MTAKGPRKWSKTAANNGNVDPDVNFAEGMAPSAVNDSARAVMAGIAKYRDDLNGTVVTAGSGTAYTITTNQGSDSLADGLEVAFSPHADSGAAPTLAVDGLAAKPIRIAPNVAVPAGALKSGAIYRATYFTSNSGEWILQNVQAIVTDSISDASVTNAKLSNMDANKIKGRATQSNGAPEDVGLGAGLSMSGLNLVISLVGQPHGRLTLTSGTPILSADVTAASTVYYTPYIGDLIPIYDGASWTLRSFAELSLTLVAAHSANAIFDCFTVDDSGVLRLVTGPAWATATAGAGARGTGASTTELSRLNGIWTNKNSMTGRYGSTTISVGANRGTYVGSILIDGTNGQISCHSSYGQSRVFGVWNAYNRRPIKLRAGDSTSSWAYQTATTRQSRGQSGNSALAFCGLAEEMVTAHFTQNINFGQAGATNGPMLAEIGIGVNSTTTYSGRKGVTGSQTTTTAGSGAASYLDAAVLAEATIVPFIGINALNMLEKANSVGGLATTFSGTETNMVLDVSYMG